LIDADAIVMVSIPRFSWNLSIFLIAAGGVNRCAQRPKKLQTSIMHSHSTWYTDGRHLTLPDSLVDNRAHALIKALPAFSSKNASRRLQTALAQLAQWEIRPTV
jgi:hypothetical protein